MSLLELEIPDVLSQVLVAKSTVFMEDIVGIIASDTVQVSIRSYLRLETEAECLVETILFS
jgi:hypothetical protein